jgi:hypothetical protein
MRFIGTGGYAQPVPLTGPEGSRLMWEMIVCNRRQTTSAFIGIQRAEAIRLASSFPI